MDDNASFLYDHAKAWGGEDYAEWYVAEYGADEPDDWPGHRHAYDRWCLLGRPTPAEMTANRFEHRPGLL